jgi:hypothetical protein
MAKLTFEKILGYLIIILLIIYLFRVFTRVEGFDTILDYQALSAIAMNSPRYSSLDLLAGCPDGNVLVGQMKPGNKPLLACYSPGLTNVKNDIFNKPNDNTTWIGAPKGTRVTLFSGENASGSTVATITDSDSNPDPAFKATLNFKELSSVAFSSISVTSTSSPSTPSSSTPSSSTPTLITAASCPSLSPAASAAASAADAQLVVDRLRVAEISAVASRAVSDNLLPQMSAMKGINIQCPTGEPIVKSSNMRNTKFVEAENSRESSSIQSNDYSCKGSRENNSDSCDYD